MSSPPTAAQLGLDPTSRTAAVLALLTDGYPGWVCGRHLHEPDRAGQRVGARVYDLRTELAGTWWTVESAPCRPGDCDDCARASRAAREAGRRPSRWHRYRLTCRAPGPRGVLVTCAACGERTAWLDYDGRCGLCHEQGAEVPARSQATIGGQDGGQAGGMSAV